MNTIETTPLPQRASGNAPKATGTSGPRPAPAPGAARPSRPADVASTSDPSRPAEPPAADARQSVSQAVEQLNELVQDIRRELHFTVDDESGETIIKVVDVETQEVIRQIPPQDAFDILQNFETSGVSLLRNIQA